MLFTPSGIIVVLEPNSNLFVFVSIIALQLFLLSYTLLPSYTAIDERFLQPLNAELPMLVTLSGIEIEVSPTQYSNALSPILVTLLGMEMEVNLPDRKS